MMFIRPGVVDGDAARQQSEQQADLPERAVGRRQFGPPLPQLIDEVK